MTIDKIEKFQKKQNLEMKILASNMWKNRYNLLQSTAHDSQ